MPHVLELIFQKQPQYFIDDIEDFILYRLSAENEDTQGMPKCLHLAAFSPQIYAKLEEILVIYAKECNFDSRLMSLIPQFLTKIHHQNYLKNPLDLHPLHLQNLISLLLFDPKDSMLDQVTKDWMEISEKYPRDHEKLCILFLPWLKKILDNSAVTESIFTISLQNLTKMTMKTTIKNVTWKLPQNKIQKNIP